MKNMKIVVAVVAVLVLSVSSFVMAADELVVGVSLDKLFLGRQAEMVGVKEAAEEAGAKLLVSVADSDIQQQNAQIQTFINQGVDAIMVVAIDQAAITSSIRAAEHAGIPVVTFDRELPGLDVGYHSGLDSYADGYSCGKYLLQKYDGKPRKVLELLGALNDQNAIDRSRGFEDALKEADNLEFIKAPTDWNADKALAVTENALQANPDIWAVYIPSDFMVPSVQTALKGAGRLKKVGEEGHVISMAIDGANPGYEATVEGTNDALIALPLAQLGRAAFNAAVKLANGEMLSQEKELFPGTLYTHNNVEAFKDKIWGAAAE